MRNIARKLVVGFLAAGIFAGAAQAQLGSALKNLAKEETNAAKRAAKGTVDETKDAVNQAKKNVTAPLDDTKAAVHQAEKNVVDGVNAEAEAARKTGRNLDAPK